LNDLDRKIAELKGYVVLGLASVGTLEPIPDDPEKYNLALKRLSDGKVEIQPHWSTSDTKALELVDELLGEGVGCILMSSPEMGYWSAMFSDSKVIPEAPIVMYERQGNGKGMTRAEAICRGYIDLRSRVSALARMRQKA
jgi:hypothetical protein